MNQDTIDTGRDVRTGRFLPGHKAIKPYREGRKAPGRLPTGSHALRDSLDIARRRMSKIILKQVELAERGHTRSAELLMAYVFGKPMQPIGGVLEHILSASQVSAIASQIEQSRLDFAMALGVEPAALLSAGTPAHVPTLPNDYSATMQLRVEAGTSEIDANPEVQFGSSRENSQKRTSADTK